MLRTPNPKVYHRLSLISFLTLPPPSPPPPILLRLAAARTPCRLRIRHLSGVPRSIAMTTSSRLRSLVHVNAAVAAEDGDASRSGNGSAPAAATGSSLDYDGRQLSSLVLGVKFVSPVWFLRSAGSIRVPEADYSVETIHR